jgi:hypothetical protein
MVSIYVGYFNTLQTASAITAEVAKKCAELSGKAYPPRVVGNPAAGFLNGTAADYRKYFNKCVADGGSVEQPADSAHQASPENRSINDNATSK